MREVESIRSTTNTNRKMNPFDQPLPYQRRDGIKPSFFDWG